MRTTVFATGLLIAGLPVLAHAQAAPATPTPSPAAPVTATPTPAAPARPVATAPAPSSAPVTAPVAVSVMPAKIALVDTSAFAAQATGVKRYVNAVKSLQTEFQPKQNELNTIQARIKAISDELTKLGTASVVDPSTVQNKQDEIERLQRELKYKKEQADSDFAKRYEVVVGPVSTDIGKALDQFALQHGITMILDISKLLPAILAVNPGTNLTRAFIADYNSKHP